MGPSTQTRLYELACRILRELALIVQYSVVLCAIIVKHLPGMPTAIPGRNLVLNLRNIGSLPALLKSFKVAWNPLPKEQFASLGQAEGLSLKRNIIYKPASGLCLGSALLFLSLFKLKHNLRVAAEQFHWGAPEEAVKMQGLYDAMLSGAPASKNHEAMHIAIIQSLAKFQGFEDVEASKIVGDAASISTVLCGLPVGSYLVQFTTHTIALIKTCVCQAIFDLNEGLGIDQVNSTEMFTQIIEYYGTGIECIKVIRIN